jgi:hypothetical protein
MRPARGAWRPPVAHLRAIGASGPQLVAFATPGTGDPVYNLAAGASSTGNASVGRNGSSHCGRRTTTRRPVRA